MWATANTSNALFIFYESCTAAASFFSPFNEVNPSNVGMTQTWRRSEKKTGIIKKQSDANYMSHKCHFTLAFVIVFFMLSSCDSLHVFLLHIVLTINRKNGTRHHSQSNNLLIIKTYVRLVVVAAAPLVWWIRVLWMTLFLFVPFLTSFAYEHTNTHTLVDELFIIVLPLYIKSLVTDNNLCHFAPMVVY